MNYWWHSNGGIWFPVLVLSQSCRELKNLLIKHFFPPLLLMKILSENVRHRKKFGEIREVLRISWAALGEREKAEREHMLVLEAAGAWSKCGVKCGLKPRTLQHKEGIPEIVRSLPIIQHAFWERIIPRQLAEVGRFKASKLKF